MPPLVSVIIPVYNRGDYARQAIDSILCQTLEDIELIVVDDGSGPETIRLLESYRDPRFILFRQPNRGPAVARNLGIASARGVYLAFQDSDDVSLPDRLRRQVAFLERHPDVGLVGTAARIWESDTPTRRKLLHPSGNAALQRRLLFGNPFIATSVMVRRDVWDRVGPFPEDAGRIRPEDYDQWAKLARVTKIANLGEPLVIYREVPGSQSRQEPKAMQQQVLEIAVEHLSWATGIDRSNPVLPAIVRWVAGTDPTLSSEVGYRQAEHLLAAAFARVSGRGPVTASLEAKRFVAWTRLRRQIKGVMAGRA